MCIIIVCDKTPSHDILIDCANENPDLCGISWIHSGIVETHRGLQINQLLNISDKIPPKTHRIYHFRIATMGRIDVVNSHPFPLHRRKTLSHTYSTYALAHNGIFSGMGDRNESDTLKIVKFLEHEKPQRYYEVCNTLATISNSRIAFADGKREAVYTFGCGWSLYDGMLFSVPYPYKRYTSYLISPPTAIRECPVCGVRLLGHEVGICDDCMESYLNGGRGVIRD